VHTRVHLDQDADGRPGGDCRRRQGLGIANVVDVDDHVGLAGQEGGCPPFLRVNELVRDQHVIRPRPNHDDRFPDGGRTQPECAVFELHPGDVRALVVLDMAPQPGVQAGEPGLHVLQVRPQDVAVDYEGRRDDVVLAGAYRGPIHVANA